MSGNNCVEESSVALFAQWLNNLAENLFKSTPLFQFFYWMLNCCVDIVIKPLQLLPQWI